jgi:hypothetical protein
MYTLAKPAWFLDLDQGHIEASFRPELLALFASSEVEKPPHSYLLLFLILHFLVVIPAGDLLMPLRLRLHFP